MPRHLRLLRGRVMHLRPRDITLRPRVITEHPLLLQDRTPVQNMTEARAGTIVFRLAVRMPVQELREVTIGTNTAAPAANVVIIKMIKI